MKIITKSNYDDERLSEYVVAEGLNQYYGKLIYDFLLNSTDKRDSSIFELVEDNYILYEFEPWKGEALWIKTKRYY